MRNPTALIIKINQEIEALESERATADVETRKQIDRKIDDAIGRIDCIREYCS